MTDVSSPQQPAAARRPLPIPIVPGMPIIETNDVTAGRVVGVTQAYCIYRLSAADRLCVARWRDIALGNVCPVDALLPHDVTENDRRNSNATLLRELLALQQLGPLTAAQTTVLHELHAYLCDARF